MLGGRNQCEKAQAMRYTIFGLLLLGISVAGITACGNSNDTGSPAQSGAETPAADPAPRQVTDTSETTEPVTANIYLAQIAGMT